MKIGLLGMGTIGTGVFEIAQTLSDVDVKKVLEVRFKADYITDKIEDILNDPEIELVSTTSSISGSFNISPIRSRIY